jgi:uncharacterized surface protein with fasciclin (FAS1) repeats
MKSDKKSKKNMGMGKGKGSGGELSTILEVVEARTDLQALNEAILRAGLDEALESEGPLTLFAPDNDAFNGLIASDPDLSAHLFTNDNYLPQLVDLLIYHILLGEALASQLQNGLVLETANGEAIEITRPPLAVNGYEIVSKDNTASNGVVQVLDGVLLPSFVFFTVYTRIGLFPELSTLDSLLISSGLSSVLNSASDEGYTLLAPTNEAFNALPATTVDFLLSPEGEAQLSRILSYHVLPGVLTSGRLVQAEFITLEGGNVQVCLDHEITFDGASVVDQDILANNGVMYIIDSVLNPDAGDYTCSYYGGGYDGKEGGKGGKAGMSGMGGMGGMSGMSGTNGKSGMKGMSGKRI